MRFLTVGLFIILLIFTRFFNLEKTARFIWDESSDLVNIMKIYTQKDITLIGPISEDGNKVFGSLTYYMLIPFAVIGNFDPTSTAYGAAFWGVITCILFLIISYKINKKFEVLTLLLIIFWSAILIPSRWAWNPNLMPFWSALSIIMILSKNRFKYFLSGLFLGLTIHHHYLGAFTTFGLWLVILKDCIKSRNYKNIIYFSFGSFFAISPFILFDLTHKPGLFLSRILYFNNLDSNLGILDTFSKIGSYVISNNYFLLLSIIFITPLVWIDIKKRSSSLNYLFVFIFSSLLLTLTKNYYDHYLLASLPFLFTYLIYKRERIGNIFSKMLILIIIFSSLINFPKIINNVTWETNIPAIRNIAQIMENEIKLKDLKNVNVVVLQSPDPNTYGRRYRDLLLIENINLKNKHEYEISDHLFVITFKPYEEIIKDSAYEIKIFKEGKLENSWDIPNSQWKVFLLGK
jgi:hypothetical protein